jgi:transposase
VAGKLWKVVRLEENVRQELQALVRSDAPWRQRERAQTILLLGQGRTPEDVAQVLEVNTRTIFERRRAWLARGAESLVDAPRSGAPPHLSPEEQARVVQWAREAPHSAVQLLERHVAAGGRAVHTETIVKILKKAGLVWKRTRASLSKKETRRPSSTGEWNCSS